MPNKCFVMSFSCWFIFVFLNYFPHTFGNSYRCIISTWKHESIQQIRDRNHITSLKLCGSSDHISCTIRNPDNLCVHIDRIFFTDQQAQIASHDFSQGGNLDWFIRFLLNDGSECIPIDNNKVCRSKTRKKSIEFFRWLIKILNILLNEIFTS